MNGFTTSARLGAEYEMPLTPTASVIIPVRNRRDLLERTLEALDRQTAGSFEVIVVDDGSTDGAGELAAAHVIGGRPVTVLDGGGRGAVAARTVGAAAARGEVLAFTDSDCEPDPDWLAAALARIEGGADLVHGPTRPARTVLPLERSVNECDGGLFPSCNLVVRRSTFDAVGGFDRKADDRLGFRPSRRARGLGFGEDTIFGWTVRRAGFEVAFEPDALVHHTVFPRDLREWLGRGWQVGAFPQLVREVPELRQTVVRHGVLFSHRSRVPVYAFGAAALTRRPALVAAAGAWWAAHRFRATLRPAPMPVADRVRALPAQLLLDAVHAAALVTGSVRARTLLL